MNPITQAWSLQKQIVGAMVLQRIASKQSNSRLGLIISVLEPIFVVGALWGIRYFASGKSTIHGLPLLTFIVTGFLPFYIARLTIMDIMSATAAKSPSLMFPAVTKFDNVLARLVYACTVSCLTMFASFFIMIVVFNGDLPNDILEIFLAIYLLIWFSAAVGLIFGVIARYAPVIRIVFSALLRIVMYVSGTFYLAEEIPIQYLDYLQWNPMFHGIEMMRQAWIPGYVSPIASVGYLAATSLILSVIGMALERQTRRV